MANAIYLLEGFSRAVSRNSFNALTASKKRCLRREASLFARPSSKRAKVGIARVLLKKPIPEEQRRPFLLCYGQKFGISGVQKQVYPLHWAPVWSKSLLLWNDPIRNFSRAPFDTYKHEEESLAPVKAAFVEVEVEDDEDAYAEVAPELEEEEEEGGEVFYTEERLVNNEKMLQINKADYTVSSILDKISRAKLDLKPAYQRDYVWDKKTASKLIESLLLNIPVPTMFFHEKERGKLEVVDGKQRLTSIWSYIVEERFPDGTPFALVGLEVLRKLNNRLYSDLSDDLKESLQDYALNVHTISRHSDEDVVFEVFERLNMGSTQLNEQELRNCIYQGSYNTLLEELVLNGYMLLAMRAEVPHKRMRDRELILRFFALRTGGIDGFTVPVKTWLNEQMRHNMDVAPADAAAMKADFERCIRLAVEVFGQDHVFRPLRPGLRKQDEPRWDSDLNVALWDTIMYGFLPFHDDGPILAARNDLKRALMDLMTKDVEFRRALVSSKKALRCRSQKWNKALAKVLNSRSARD